MKVSGLTAVVSSCLASSVSAFSAITAGSKIPSVELFHDFAPDAKHNMAEYTAGKKVAVVGLPGAFTPTCSNRQVPGYLESQDAIKDAGIEEVIVYCVNDPAVMNAWAKDQGIEGSNIKFFSDPSSEFTRACDLEMTADGPKSVGIINRCKRFAMIVEDSTITAIAVAESELDPAGDDFPEKTLAPALIEMAKS